MRFPEYCKGRVFFIEFMGKDEEKYLIQLEGANIFLMLSSLFPELYCSLRLNTKSFRLQMSTFIRLAESI